MLVQPLHGAQLHVVANQWYWVYGIDAVTLFLYTTHEQELLLGDLRLLQLLQSMVVEEDHCCHYSVRHSLCVCILRAWLSGTLALQESM